MIKKHYTKIKFKNTLENIFGVTMGFHYTQTDPVSYLIQNDETLFSGNEFGFYINIGLYLTEKQFKDIELMELSRKDFDFLKKYSKYLLRKNYSTTKQYKKFEYKNIVSICAHDESHAIGQNYYKLIIIAKFIYVKDDK